MVRFLEITCLLTIIGTIAVIAIPKLGDLERRSIAAGVLVDLETMREAVYRFYSDSAFFPAEEANAPIPTSLAAYLPRDFVSRRAYGALTYKNWPGTTRRDTTPAAQPPPDPVGGVVPNVAARIAETRAGGGMIAATNIVGVVIVPNDAKILATAVSLSPRAARFIVGNRYAFVFFGS